MLETFLLLTSLVVLTYYYIKYIYSHWTRNGIQQLSPTFPFGNASEMFLGKSSFGNMFRGFYWRFKKMNVPVGGFYFALKPNLLVLDPEIIKHIMVKDFNHFTDRVVFCDEKNDPMTAHLFNLGGTKWRKMRTKLTPTFTSGKMKMMFGTLVDCSKDMMPLIDQSIDNSEPLDIKDLLARFTIDVICSCAFGLTCNSLKDPKTEFKYHGNKVFIPDTLDHMRRLCGQTMPWFMRFFKIRGLNKKTTDFFYNLVSEMVTYRETNNVYRKDFLQLLLQLKNQGKIEDDNKEDRDVKVDSIAVEGKELITLDEIAAQCFVFFLAGFETSSTTMTFCLFELSINNDIQEKLRAEVFEVLERHNGELTYAAISDMKYMDQVIDETLRKYPPVPFLARECTKDIKIPKTNYVMKKGCHVRIPIWAIQHDPDYYPEPEKFDPERFSEENKSKVVPFTYMPFGEGPRVCIGLRFGVMQTKVGLTELLRRYEFTLNAKTQMPLKMEPNSFTLSAVGDIWLNVTALKNKD